MTAGATWRREAELSITRSEYLRILPAALGGMPFLERDDGIEAGDGPRQVWIKFLRSGIRSLGSLNLPTLAVTMELGGFTDVERTAFLRRFDQAFQRGGG